MSSESNKDSTDQDKHCHCDKSEGSQRWSSKNVLIGAAAGGAAVFALVTSAPVVLLVIGFSTGGVLAGSAAATAQATIGNVVAGGVFATLQSIGAVGGLSKAATGAATAAGAAVGAGIGAAIPTSGETDDSNCPPDSDEG